MPSLDGLDCESGRGRLLPVPGGPSRWTTSALLMTLSSASARIRLRSSEGRPKSKPASVLIAVSRAIISAVFTRRFILGSRPMRRAIARSRIIISSPSWTTAAAPCHFHGGHHRRQVESPKARGQPRSFGQGRQPGSFQRPLSGKVQRPATAIDGRTTRHPDYAASQRVRKRILIMQLGTARTGGWISSLVEAKIMIRLSGNDERWLRCQF